MYLFEKSMNDKMTLKKKQKLILYVTETYSNFVAFNFLIYLGIIFNMLSSILQTSLVK